jgi:hypothetical protein
MGGKETSGGAYSPPRPPRPPRAPIPRPPFRWPDASEWRDRINAALSDALSNTKVIDGLYLTGVAAVVLVSAYILAFG